MKIKSRSVESEEKIEVKMTPMIDVVFQLLVFFLFTFKIVPIEGEIGVNMPPMTAGSTTEEPEIDPEEKIKIKLRASEEGRLIAIVVGDNPIGTELKVLRQLLRDQFVGPGGKADEVEVEIDADRQLLYLYLIHVTNAIQQAGIRKINFTDPLTGAAGAG